MHDSLVAEASVQGPRIQLVQGFSAQGTPRAFVWGQRIITREELRVFLVFRMLPPHRSLPLHRPGLSSMSDPCRHSSLQQAVLYRQDSRGPAATPIYNIMILYNAEALITKVFGLRFAINIDPKEEHGKLCNPKT